MSHDHRADEEQNARRRANLLRVKYFDTRSLGKLPLFRGVLSNDQMRFHKSVILSQEKGKMVIAITAATPQHSITDLRSMFQDYQMSFVMISELGFDDFMFEYDPPEKIEYEDITIKKVDNQEDAAQISKTLDSVRSDDIFNYLVRQASLLGASDVHLECQEGRVRIRFRVDGVLHEIAEISYEKHRQLSSTFAVNANISTSSPKAQTGHMKHTITSDEGEEISEVNMRIETVPTSFGQDAVIRLFTLDRDLLNLKRLGLDSDQEAIIDDIVAHPSGLVLSVGPTGSGKTTTLYSILNKLNTPDRKIITLEDPIEYTLPGVVQIPVDTEHDDSFAEKLRAVLRLDPDVIMVGEIRDADTAKTALQAALSGHLVLSTFHAADTTAALSRLYEFLGNNPLLTSAIRLIIAQRLVRKLDEKSRKEDKPSDKVMSIIKDAMNQLPEERRINVDEATFYKAGKSEEAPFGYVGQTAVVELLTMTHDLEMMMHADVHTLDAKELRQRAIDDGMATLLQCAIKKAAKGETTLEETFRVIG